MEILSNDNPEELQKDQDVDEETDDDKEKIYEEELNFRQNILTRVTMEIVEKVFTYLIREAEFLIEIEVKFLN
jgi:hypothetical protein